MTDPRIQAAAKAIAERNGFTFPQFTHKGDATAAMSAIDKAATITSIEQLDALPGGSRIMLGCDLLMRLADTVDDSNWIDLSTASPVDNESIQLILCKVQPKVIVQYGSVQP